MRRFVPINSIAISLVDDLVPRDRAQQILRLVEEQLVNPVGLRTLSPYDPRYRGRYEGGVVERDGAYHLKGTVWPFLLGPFVTAWIKVHGKNAAALKQARSFLEGIGTHLKETCLGQVSEIFDAEAPHRARLLRSSLVGCGTPTSLDRRTRHPVRDAENHR